MHPKFIFIFGGVMSGLGKGGITASLAKTFQARGYKVTCVKIDPYINIDAGLFSPYEHGEVFVLDDGGEVDQDLGNYERFLGIALNRNHNITTGKVYSTVIEKERRGDYLGKTVQIIPHITEEIKRRITAVVESCKAQLVFIEIGGTVGDIESMPFLEAARQMKNELSSRNVFFVHLSLVPEIAAVGEQKTKPTQHSVKSLLELGVQPDVVVCRSSRKLEPDTKKKIAMFCNVPVEAVISDPDVDTIYQLPSVWEEEGLCDYISEKLGLGAPDPNYQEWPRLLQNLREPKDQILVAIPGKYTRLKDSYLSISEALKHCQAYLQVGINIRWLDTTEFKVSDLADVDGIIVPGGFGSRGVEGKFDAIRHAREHDIPFLGLCFGFQLAVVEFARHKAGLTDANSTEIDPHTPFPVIDILPEQAGLQQMGATMRLGRYTATLKENSLVRSLYGKAEVSERHRHRYEVNPAYVESLRQAGIVFSGESSERKLMEFLELPGHCFFVGTQAHPEFQSTLLHPAPLFLGFVTACQKRKQRSNHS